MTRRQQLAILESLLYVWGEPLPFSEIGAILDLSPEDVEALVADLQGLFDDEQRGLAVRRVGDAAQLSTREEYYPYLSKLYTAVAPNRLSHSAMETLAIIAYEQPVSRVRVDQVRGVKSTSAIDTLLQRGLIEEAGRLEQVGRPIIYCTTREFLRAFAMESLDDLPSRETAEALLAEEDHHED